MHRLPTREFSIDKKRRDPTTIAESRLFLCFMPCYPDIDPYLLTFPFSHTNVSVPFGIRQFCADLITFGLSIVYIVTSSLLSVHHRWTTGPS